MIAAIKSKIKYPTSNTPFGSAYDGEVTNAKQIYGKEFTRIRQIDQLSKAAGRLIQKEIRELYS